LTGRLPLVVRLRGGQGDGGQEDDEQETYEGVSLLPEDMSSSMHFVSNSELEVVDTEAQGVKDIRFTPAAQAYIETALREHMGYIDPKPDDGVDVVDQPDTDDMQRGLDIFSNMLNRHPDRTSKRRGAGAIKVDMPCANADGSVWEYLQAVGDEVDSGNSSEFEEFLENARASFNRTDTHEDTRNPADEFDDDMIRDEGADAAYKLMFPGNDNGEAKYKAWRAIMIQSRKTRQRQTPHHPPHTQPDQTAGTSGGAAATTGFGDGGVGPSCSGVSSGGGAAAAEEEDDDSLVHGLGLSDKSENEEDGGPSVGESDDEPKPLNPATADEKMQRNFGRPFEFSGRIKQNTHDDDYTSTSSQASSQVPSGQGMSDSSSSDPKPSEQSWEGLNATDEFQFNSEVLREEEANQGLNVSAMLQWEKDVALRDLCSYMPDDAIFPEDHARQIHMLVHFGAQFNRSDWWGWYPLHHAAFKGLGTVCRELVKLGADIDCTNRDGTTPLMIAARHGRLPATKMLLDLGADFRLLSKDGESVMDKALRSEHRKLGVMIYDLFLKHRDECLSDGRSLHNGMKRAVSAAPSMPPTNVPYHSILQSTMGTGNMTNDLPDPRNMWRPMGWNWRDIDKQKKTMEEAPEVREYKEKAEWEKFMQNAQNSQGE